MARKNGDGNYEVGYGKPPLRTRFQKGQSGSPKGRPRGSRNATTILNEALNERVVVTENGRRKSATKLEVIFKQLVNKAAQGDHRSIQLLLNQGKDGKELGEPDDGRIPIEVTRAMLKDIENNTSLPGAAMDDDGALPDDPLDIEAARAALSGANVQNPPTPPKGHEAF